MTSKMRTLKIELSNVDLTSVHGGRGTNPIVQLHDSAVDRPVGYVGHIHDLRGVPVTGSQIGHVGNWQYPGGYDIYLRSWGLGPYKR